MKHDATIEKEYRPMEMQICIWGNVKSGYGSEIRQRIQGQALVLAWRSCCAGILERRDASRSVGDAGPWVTM